MVTNVNISKKQRKGTLDASWTYEFIEGRSHNSQLVLKMACLREHRFIYIAIIVKIASFEALNRPHGVSRETVWIRTYNDSGKLINMESGMFSLSLVF
ncbi:hypothetical protein Nepgr_013921 [Nepenthes gracilis]|uniref:Uncharacterized protein n=1 Tax=Nepenthes gracilis TaxID=150966 RepID=A0AAD3SIA5_NEPGR|nr:hypothetical protein Nepgr_013921 [Nepenthes gracilis]